MPRNRFSLEPGDPRTIEVTWEAAWKNITVSFNDKVLGVIPDREHLKQGATYTLDDGSTIRLGLKGGLVGPVLDVKRDGRQLFDLSPEQQMKNSATAVYVVGAYTLLTGLSNLASAGLTTQAAITTALGLLLLALGFATYRGSKVALVIVLLMYLADGVLSVVAIAQGRVTFPGVPGPLFAVGASCFRLVFLIWMASPFLLPTRAKAASQG